MRALILLRHGLTEGNARRLYYGWTDLSLSEIGREQAAEIARMRPLPVFNLYITSGLRRTDETLFILTRREPDIVLPDLREMHFGAFEMHSYEELRRDPDYQRWISGDPWSGDARCPGGESQNEFRERVLRGAEALLSREWESALAVVHGGVIANLMREWFPGEPRNFFEWQPGPCAGYRVEFNGATPVRFEEI